MTGLSRGELWGLIDRLDELTERDGAGARVRDEAAQPIDPCRTDSDWPVSRSVSPSDALVAENERLKERLDGMARAPYGEYRSLLAENERLGTLLERLLQWDHLDGSADGPYWRREIESALARVRGTT